MGAGEEQRRDLDQTVVWFQRGKGCKEQAPYAVLLIWSREQGAGSRELGWIRRRAGVGGVGPEPEGLSSGAT